MRTSRRDAALSLLIQLPEKSSQLVAMLRIAQSASVVLLAAKLVGSIAMPSVSFAQTSYDPAAQGCTLQVDVGGGVIHVMSFNLQFDVNGIGFHLTGLTGYGAAGRSQNSVVPGSLVPTFFDDLAMESTTYNMYTYSGSVATHYEFEFGFLDPYAIHYVVLHSLHIGGVQKKIASYGLGCLLGGVPMAIWQPKDFVRH
ncbi:uncharacterized protein L969DRAFT_16099 [Mixia osmundae IAM 14324]|uniref:uncharacterized protein n=1 Tax=Mixia osmundae (strain CBS 9802 / IAM 14324 / JCM 22182 / KY 12970) TaxID=764103 RepID=UPI0004A55820|nr:uncharacterized protein L969DRAFT_16099 [Mixia osmundae IAM 14324]KEI40738.1 hypothetical protein L969DRAFT_16099 [Mixia osmundae IAM 14324]